ncbi:hypothetical protein CALCODRAFT_8902 [Calocera cornea HHB12733]|uniref:Uncharacterized protein n=1 Tax=Calocera cornea HHB12733 TaxID=1353952 RepID=A0A165J547_9BASI|nr:hypothetical protein CALCODRAFT_8902 [Calocera cornea HHB12733]
MPRDASRALCFHSTRRRTAGGLSGLPSTALLALEHPMTRQHPLLTPILPRRLLDTHDQSLMRQLHWSYGEEAARQFFGLLREGFGTPHQAEWIAHSVVLDSLFRPVGLSATSRSEFPNGVKPIPPCPGSSRFGQMTNAGMRSHCTMPHYRCLAVP